MLYTIYMCVFVISFISYSILYIIFFYTTTSDALATYIFSNDDAAATRRYLRHIAEGS